MGEFISRLVVTPISNGLSSLRESIRSTQGNALLKLASKNNIPEVLTYLSKHRNSDLQKKAQEIFAGLTEVETIATLIAITQHAEETQNPNLLKTCRKIVPLSRFIKIAGEDAKETATRWVQAFGEVDSAKANKIKTTFLGKIRGWLPFFGKRADSITECAIRAYSITETPPRDIIQAQQQWMFYRSLWWDIRALGGGAFVWLKSNEASQAIVDRIFNVAGQIPKLSPYITDANRARAVQITRLAVPLLTLLGATLLYSLINARAKMVPNKVPYLNYSLNSKVLSGEILEPVPVFSTTGEPVVDNLQLLVERLAMPKKVACLIGPPGVGKTELVRSLTWMIVHGKIPSLKDKVVFEGDMNDFIQGGGWDQQQMIQTTPMSVVNAAFEGVEDRVIQFLDEFAAAFKPKSGIGSETPFADKLKTAFTGKFKYIVATTKDEYMDYINRDRPMKDRLVCIEISEPSDEYMEAVLENHARRQGKIEITPKAIQKILQLSKNLPGDNARKSITLLDRILVESTGRPKKLRNCIVGQEQKIVALRRKNQQTINTKGARSEEAKAGQNNLEQERARLTRLQDRLRELESNYARIGTITNSIDKTEKRVAELARKLAKLPDHQNASESVEKEYLHLDLAVLPGLKALRERKISEFNQAYEEVVPLQIDENTVEQWSVQNLPDMIRQHLQEFLQKQFDVKSTPSAGGLGMNLTQLDILVDAVHREFKLNQLDAEKTYVSVEDVATFIERELTELRVIESKSDSLLSNLKRLSWQLIIAFPKFELQT